MIIINNKNYNNQEKRFHKTNISQKRYKVKKDMQFSYDIPNILTKFQILDVSELDVP